MSVSSGTVKKRQANLPSFSISAFEELKRSKKDVVRPLVLSSGIAEGFLGTVRQISVCDQDENQDSTTFVLKSMPSMLKSKELQDFVSAIEPHKRECQFYSLYSKRLHNIYCKESCECPIPRLISYSDSLLIIEDLTKNGYSTRRFNRGLDLSETLSAVISLAKIHRASYNCEANICVDTQGDVEKLLADLCVPGGKALIEKLKDHLTINAVKYLKSYCNGFESHCVNDSNETELVSLIHGDLWSGNILFGPTGDAVIIDWQFAQEGNPVEDIVVLLCTSVQTRIRQDHVGTILSSYNQVVGEKYSITEQLYSQSMSFSLPVIFGSWQTWVEAYGEEIMSRFVAVLEDISVLEKNV